MARRKNVKNNKKLLKAIISVAVLIVLALVSEPLLENLEPTSVDGSNIESEFSVHFIDVGQGDCTLIKTPEGSMLIDAGENGYEQTVLDYLETQGIDELKYLIASHPHSDHIGGVAEVLEAITVENVIMPKLSESNTPTTATYEKTLKAIKSSGAKVIAANPGNEYSFGEVEFTVVAPFEQDDNLNNMSVVIRLTYGGYSFLFSADAEKAVEKQILESGCDISADVYKVAHHGSSTSNTENFVRAINPTYAVISCGEDNSYGHPHEEVVELLDNEGIVCYSTAQLNTIVFAVDNNELKVLTVNESETEALG